MSENESGESKTLGAFLLGFLTGVLVCLGIGGGLFFVVQRNVMIERRRAVEMELVARESEMRSRLEAEKAEKALQEAKKNAAPREAKNDKDNKDR